MVGLHNPLHIALVLLVVLLLFGAKRLPELGRSLGTGMREFTQSIAGADGSPADTAGAQVGPGSDAPADAKRDAPA